MKAVLLRAVEFMRQITSISASSYAIIENAIANPLEYDGPISISPVRTGIPTNFSLSQTDEGVS